MKAGNGNLKTWTGCSKINMMPDELKAKILLRSIMPYLSLANPLSGCKSQSL